MALLGKENIFKSKWLRIHRGLNAAGDKGIVQVVVVSPATREAKAINIGDQRWQEVAADLDSAARALRASFGG